MIVSTPTRTSKLPPIDAVDGILRDGTPVAIRAVVPADRERLAALFAGMSPISIRHRFFAAKREVTAEELTVLLGNGASHVAIAVVARTGEGETFLGCGRYVVLETGDVAEVAFEVADAEQGHGIGTLLLERLAQIARQRGISVFRAEVEADNRAMLDVFTHVGFVVRESCSQGVYGIELRLFDDAKLAASVAARHQIAEAAARARGATPTVQAKRDPGG